MNQEQKIQELYSMIYALINEVESLKRVNMELRRENDSLKRQNAVLKSELDK
ncbi:MAG: hypothetical protein Q8P34_14115 [Bacteroidota bacterium]|nr:hypothetical protein [Bacteroidota bacterium]